MTGQTMTAETTMTAAEPDEAAAPQPESGAVPEVTIAELLVEEVSIDGMCGVY
jgi:mycofactocin precursor